MPLLGRPRRKLTWAEVADRLRTIGPPDVTVSDDSTSTWVAWAEGPSISTVQAAAGELTGWQWRAMMPGPMPAPPPAGDAEPTIWVRRSLGSAALAVALVRFYGAHGRYFTTSDVRGRAPFAELCDTDHPATSGFPIVDAIAAALLARADNVDDDPDAVDRLSNHLRAIGYERLWTEAYKNVR